MISLAKQLTGPVLVTGSGGMLGWDLVRALRVELGLERVIAADRDIIDITSNVAIGKALRHYHPSIVLNAAAFTDVDGAEKDKKTAMLVNGTAVSYLTRACQEIGAKLIQFGTDQVFDGKGNSPRSEEDEPKPVNYYAETKLAGDKAALSDARSLVIRAQWLYGEKKDRFSVLRNRDVFTPFSDQYGAPTWTKHLSDVVVELIRRNANGLYHFSYDDYSSWADVYAFIKKEWKLSVKLEPVKTDEKRLPARRPLFSVMTNRKLVAALGRDGMGSWQEPLKKFLAMR